MGPANKGKPCSGIDWEIECDDEPCNTHRSGGKSLLLHYINDLQFSLVSCNFFGFISHKVSDG